MAKVRCVFVTSITAYKPSTHLSRPDGFVHFVCTITKYIFFPCRSRFSFSFTNCSSWLSPQKVRSRRSHRRSRLPRTHFCHCRLNSFHSSCYRPSYCRRSRNIPRCRPTEHSEPQHPVPTELHPHPPMALPGSSTRNFPAVFPPSPAHGAADATSSDTLLLQEAFRREIGARRTAARRPETPIRAPLHRFGHLALQSHRHTRTRPPQHRHRPAHAHAPGVKHCRQFTQPHPLLSI